MATLAAAFATSASTIAAGSEALDNVDSDMEEAADLDDAATLAAISATLAPEGQDEDLALAGQEELPASETVAPIAETDAEEVETVEAIEVAAREASDVRAPNQDTTRPATTRGDEEDMDRLFASTEGRLATVENSRRRANIEHLKAAVAARVADTQMAADGSTAADYAGVADTSAEYRDDLARVMRPRRVRVDVSRRHSANEARPAPLILVSEQRVDSDRAAVRADAAPVMPRRVTSDEGEIAPTLRPEGETLFAAEHATPLVLNDPQSAIEPELDVEAIENARTAPRKIVNSLANLAHRAGQIASGLGRSAPVAASTEEDDEAEVEIDVIANDASVAEHSTEQTLIEPDPAEETVAEMEEAEASEDEDPIAALEAQLAREIEADTMASEAGHEDDASDEDVDHFARFADVLSESSATEIDEVIELGAEYLTERAKLPEFKRMQLLRLVRIATDGSISRNEAIELVARLTNDNVLEALDGNFYRLSRSL